LLLELNGVVWVFIKYCIISVSSVITTAFDVTLCLLLTLLMSSACQQFSSKMVSVAWTMPCKHSVALDRCETSSISEYCELDGAWDFRIWQWCGQPKASCEKLLLLSRYGNCCGYHCSELLDSWFTYSQLPLPLGNCFATLLNQKIISQ